MKEELVKQGNWLEMLYEKTFDYVSDPEMWLRIGLTLLQIILIVFLSKIVVTIVKAAVNRIFQHRQGSKLQMEQRRVDTLRVLVNNVTSYAIYFLAILLILQQLGVDLRPVLVSAGVLGLAVGFGAQSLVRDVITGFFIIFEDQFAVGDFVTINNMTGTVQEIGLRITRIRSWTGEVHIFPNGTITHVTNFSLHNTLAVVDVSVPYEEDLGRMERIIMETMKQAQANVEEIVGEPQFLGVQALGPSEVTMRLTVECKPNTHHGVSRKLRAMIRQELSRQGIEIPYPRVVTMTGRGFDQGKKQAES
ncbi:mechanosensitive ion channel family protein [Brevibacillus ruminantium]|uniref:Mechanosensitive ion channel family protein n=1 Tax=Brevibacillus ruminantium TaxID=2950604 RepID=A0ABY4WME4_9BACL|nr:mechanosensitive ion channel family protein [Brevibacillus ruminantium]USG65786.1 mechanosensitive ion channel family protein [Brevibacillus ruminantium]